MTPEDQERLSHAARFAIVAHAGQTRKGSDVPYVGHVLRVGGLVLEHGGHSDLVIAGFLHDTLEDCPSVEAGAIEDAFGVIVRRIVENLSDTLPGDTPERKSPWRDRKTAYLTTLETADSGTRLVAACDKLDNLSSLLADLEHVGIAIFDRFNSSPRQARWYYEAVRERLGDDLPPILVAQIDRLLTQLAGFVTESSPER